MAELLALTECSFESLTNNEKSIKLSDCRKCADLEKQVHQVLNKLSCAQLIIAYLTRNINKIAGIQRYLSKSE